jgi:hypothetical protein
MRGAAKPGLFALLAGFWRCLYGRYPEFPNSFSRYLSE